MNPGISVRVIWLASYPKSGNTWMRMLIANLSAGGDTPIDINDVRFDGGMASARAPFERLSLIDSALLTYDESDRIRPLLYRAMRNSAGDEEDGDISASAQFIKVHDAYTFTADGDALLGGSEAADGAILVVRDPRGVAPSLASHLGLSIDQAIAFMQDVNASFCGAPGRFYNQLRQQLPGWTGHTASWLDQRDLPVAVVRYEDLQSNTADELRRVLDFAGHDATDEQIERAVRFADFKELQRQEREKGFGEAPRPHANGNFFRRGVADGWRDELTDDQIARIEAAHAPMMRRLGYELPPSDAACTQSAIAGESVHTSSVR